MRNRPIYHDKRESIEAHLAVVFAALAVTHEIEHKTGWSIKRFAKPRAATAPSPSAPAGISSAPKHPPKRSPRRTRLDQLTGLRTKLRPSRAKKWRIDRLRDVVSAREVSHEWLAAIEEATAREY